MLFSPCSAAHAGRPQFTGSQPEKTHIDHRPDGKLSGHELGKRLTSQVAPKSPFEGFHNVSAISKAGDSQPMGRKRTGLWHDNETHWTTEIERRIKNGDINEHTLAVFDTGHGLTAAEAMTRLLGSDVIAHYDSKTTTERAYRKLVQDQAQSLVPAILENQRHQTRKGVSTALLIDAHMDKGKQLDPDAIASLPTADRLHKMGIRRIFLGLEKWPEGGKPYERRKEDPNGFYSWLNRVARDGRIEVIEDGVDRRRDLVTMLRLAKKFGDGEF